MSGEITRAAFLAALFPDGLGYADVRGFRALKDRAGTYDERVRVTNVALINRMADDLTAKELDVYIGVAPRRTKENGTTANCATLAALFVDIDLKDYGGNEDAARRKLAAFPIPPTAVIKSGGGLQCYWFLAGPLDLQNGGAASSKRRLRALARAVGGDLNAAEPARILRLPGTKNFKYSTPRDVVIESFPDQRRPLADLDAVIPLADEPEISTEPTHDQVEAEPIRDVPTRTGSGKIVDRPRETRNGIHPR